MVNDPKWARFGGTNAVYSQDVLKVGQRGIPTVGIGAYRCSDPTCGKPHMTIACIDGNGNEISVLLEPETGTKIVAAIIDKLGDIGGPYIALQAMRALSLVSELATMSEIECDFLDGHGLQNSARAMLGQDPCVVGQILPRRYSEDDRLRAAEMMRAKRRDHPALPYRNLAEDLEMVDIVAEALGLRLGGA